MKHTASSSQAAAINTSMMHWCSGSPSGQMFSLGVCSEGWYGVPKDMVFSFPVTFPPKGYWCVVHDIKLYEEVKVKLHETIKDLESEIEVMFPRPKPPTPEQEENVSNNQTSEDKGDGEQHLETIVEEKKEVSEEGDTSSTEGSKSTTGGGETSTADGEKTDEGEGDKKNEAENGEKKSDEEDKKTEEGGETTESEEKKEGEEVPKEEQTPTD